MIRSQSARIDTFSVSSHPRIDQRNMPLVLVVLSLLCVLSPNGAAQAADRYLSPRLDPAKFMKSGDLKEGMTGYGLTVFRGIKIERFEVEILGVLENEYSETNLILARCSGGPLAKTGVIAGMSGSPVYVEEKLIGALAYAWPFTTEAIAGITPIENMLPVLDLPATERAPSDGDIKKEGMGAVPWSGEDPGSMTNSTPPDWPNRLQSFLRKDYEGALTGGVVTTNVNEGEEFSAPRTPTWTSGWTQWWQAPLNAPPQTGARQGWIPLATPLAMEGVSNEVFNRMSALFPGMGFQPVVGGSVGSATVEGIKLEPGAALGVSMVSGDLNLTGIGTVTYVEGDHILGFGHPMFQDGPTDLPMTTAYINAVLPSSRISTKMGGLIKVVGTLEQDRLPAVGGTVGGVPATVPFRVHIRNEQAGVDREFNYDLASHRFFTSRFALLCVLDAFDAATRGMRDSASDYTLTVNLKGRPPVVLTDQISSAMGTSFEIAMTLGSVVDLLMQNPYESLRIESLDLQVQAVDRLRRGTLEWIRVDRQTVEPGETVTVSVGVRPWLGELEVYQRALRIPTDYPPGQIQLSVTDAMGYIAEIQRRNPDRFRARNIEDVMRLLNEVYRNDQLFFTLAAIAPGVSMNGKEMSNLPSSVLRVMADSAERGIGMVISNKPVIQDRIQVAAPLTGSQVLLVEVEPRRADRLN